MGRRAALREALVLRTNFPCAWFCAIRNELHSVISVLRASPTAARLLAYLLLARCFYLYQCRSAGTLVRATTSYPVEENHQNLYRTNGCGSAIRDRGCK